MFGNLLKTKKLSHETKDWKIVMTNNFKIKWFLWTIFIHLCHYCRMVESVCHILFHQFLSLKYCLRFASPFADNSLFLSVTWKKNEERNSILEIYVCQLFIFLNINRSISKKGFEHFLLHKFLFFHHLNSIIWLSIIVYFFLYIACVIQ